MFNAKPFNERSRRHLLCLDLSRDDAAPELEQEIRIGRCRRLLAFARSAEWPVSHVYPRAGGRSPRPVAGLEPLPSEPVYYRTGASAFSNRVFSRAMRDQYDTELVILALSLSPTAVGTALAAHDLDLGVALVGDTLSREGMDAPGIEAIETIARALVSPFVQVRATDDLIDVRRGLRLVQA
ncbi:MAG TPA: isochorismatase family protein [Caulobacteraceae bacterium]|nr:isochorismatase family protein [Caulobacteraceae bacterium]